MDYLFIIIAVVITFLWRNRLKNKDKPRLNPLVSRIAGILLGMSVVVIGVIWFLEFSGILSSVEPGLSRAHFVGIVGVIFGPLFMLFGLGFVITCFAVPIKSIENWVAKEESDIKLW